MLIMSRVARICDYGVIDTYINTFFSPLSYPLLVSIKCWWLLLLLFLVFAGCAAHRKKISQFKWPSVIVLYRDKTNASPVPPFPYPHTSTLRRTSVASVHCEIIDFSADWTSLACKRYIASRHASSSFLLHTHSQLSQCHFVSKSERRFSFQYQIRSLAPKKKIILHHNHDNSNKFVAVFLVVMRYMSSCLPFFSQSISPLPMLDGRHCCCSAAPACDFHHHYFTHGTSIVS